MMSYKRISTLFVLSFLVAATQSIAENFYHCILKNLSIDEVKEKPRKTITASNTVKHDT